MKFTIIDTKTGEYPDLWEIALKEEWANSLCYCDMEGFAIEEDGTLILLDECGRHEYPPEGNRFKIVPIIETNADRIRAMTDEELAEFICSQHCAAECERCVAKEYCHHGHTGMIDWLKQEASDATHTI